MQLPGRMLDLSSPLDNETVLDPPFMRPKIEYRSNFDNAQMLLDIFPGLRREDLPDGEGWAFEIMQLTTHNGTHMDAPVHYQSHSIDGKRMMSIDEVPLEWFFRPGVKLDFQHLPDGHVVTATRSRRSSGASVTSFSRSISCSSIPGLPAASARTSISRPAAAWGVKRRFI
jgi:kynurenine formamidase